MATTLIRTSFWAGSHRVSVLLALAMFQSCTAVAAEDEPLAVTAPPNDRLSLVLSTELASAVTNEFKERLLDVDIDEQQLNQTVLVLEDRAGVLYLWSEDLQRHDFVAALGI
jgi:hypothetical protein